MAETTLEDMYALEFKNGRIHYQYKIWEIQVIMLSFFI